MKRTRWEYHVLMSDLVDETTIADAFTDVRRLGEDGWELVSVNYLTAYAPSLGPARVEEEDVLARVRKRLNGKFGKTSDAATAHAWTNGNGGVDAPAAPHRIDALPETRLEAWFKRPALPEG